MVDAAMELLKPATRKRKEARHDIIYMTDFIHGRSASAKAFKGFESRKGRAFLRRYAKALRVVAATFSSANVTIRPWLSPPDVRIELAKVEAFLAKPSLPPRRAAIRAKAAVAAAYSLLAWWHINASASRGSVWEQLAQILAGSGRSMYEHMRDFKKKRAPIFAKRPTRKGVIRSLVLTHEATNSLLPFSASL